MALKSGTRCCGITVSSVWKRQQRWRGKERYLVVDYVDYNPVFDCVYNLIQHLVHLHAFGCVVRAETEADYAGFFAELVSVSLVVAESHI